MPAPKKNPAPPPPPQPPRRPKPLADIEIPEVEHGTGLAVGKARRREKLVRLGWQVLSPIKFTCAKTGRVVELKNPAVVHDDEISDGDVLMFQEFGAIGPNMVAQAD